MTCEIPDPFRRVLSKLGDEDSMIAVQVISLLLTSMKDDEYSVSATPLSGVPRVFGYDLTYSDAENIYTLRLTNCAAVSLRSLHKHVWRHESVCDVTVDNFSAVRADQPGLTIALSVVRTRVQRKEKREWMPPADTVDCVDDAGTSGLLVPGDSRRDALTTISAFMAHSTNGWEPHFYASEESGGYKIVVQPVASMTLSFYVHLLDFLGTLPSTSEVLRNVVLHPYEFNDGQRAIQATVHCNTRPKTQAESAHRMRTAREAAMGPVGGIHKQQPPRKRAWYEHIFGGK